MILTKVSEKKVLYMQRHRKLDQEIYKVIVFYKLDTFDHFYYAFSETAEYCIGGFVAIGRS